MSRLTLTEIAEALALPIPPQDININAVTTDSRTLQAGDLFVALHGENFDGHNFVEQAVAAGAAAVLVDREVQADVPVLQVADTLRAYAQIAAVYRSKFSIPIAAVTGSCGKTTVKNMLTSILSQAGKVLAPEGSFNNEVGVPYTILKLRPDHDFAVFELGAKKKGDIEYLMQIVKPDVALINNAAPAHLETFGDVDGIAKVKGEIYEQLQGTAALNVDDVYAPYWLSIIKDHPVITFGLESKADITCAFIIEEHNQIRFDLVTDIGQATVTMQVLGTHNVMNALAATALARGLKISLPHIKAGLEAFAPTTRRMQVKPGKHGARVIDDSYNANPVAMRKAIEVLAKQQGRKIMVVADMLEMGHDAVNLHAELGKQIREAQIDKLYAYGDLARHTANAYGDEGAFFTDKDQLTNALLKTMDKDTVVLVKGSNGMHLEEVINVIVAE